MLGIAMFVVGIVAIVMGCNAIAKKDFQVSREWRATGFYAVRFGILVIAIGLFLIFMALIGLPLLIHYG